jgi:hypothetical protein
MKWFQNLPSGPNRLFLSWSVAFNPQNTIFEEVDFPAQLVAFIDDGQIALAPDFVFTRKQFISGG